MGADHSEVDSREQRLDAVLFDYLRAAEAGQAPDREAWLAQYPDLAGELAEFLAEQERFDRAAAPLRAVGRAAAGGESADAVPERLGDFRLVREVGRGGMGVVYEAEQLSLGRRVALKVLPLAATLGGTQLQRFHNEARAAAGLHHTNIVPVHFVGCERGVHFYAMQFIDGLSLAAVLARLRQPADPATDPQPADTPTTAHLPAPALGEANGTASTQPVALLSTAGGARGRAYFRAVAELGVQAAEALDYGHRVGVIHRDVKPGNLLLDGAGRLWVTDFGLAQVQGAESLTATGELVGTLRYMSPEQALAKRVVVDHRTDVYSLGATLYELLTLRPPFTGTDRHELLRQIAFDEPVPPRRLSRAVPDELEIIVLKALEKAPPDRYATAQELADDLRRWLDDRPIQARRPSVLQRLRKWTRRHRPAVNAAAACLLLALAAVAGSVGWAVRDREARRAERERAAATALGDAESWQEARRWPDALSAAKRAEGLLVGGEAPAFRQRVQERRKDLEAVLRLGELRSERTTKDDRETDQEYREVFRGLGIDVDALETAAAADRVRGRSVCVELAAALATWAFIRRDMQGKGEDSGWKRLLAVAQQADGNAWRSRLRDAAGRLDLKVLKELAASDDISTQPSETLTFLADALMWGKAFPEALAMMHRANRYHPEDPWISDTICFLSSGVGPPQSDDAFRFATAAVALKPKSSLPHYNLANELMRRGRLDEAIAEYQEALRLQKDYFWAHDGLGNALKDKGRLEEAIAEYREAIRIKKDFPLAHSNLSNALSEKGRLDEAFAEYREAIRLDKDFAEAHYNLGTLLCDGKKDHDAAIAEFRESLRLRKDYPEAHCGLGVALAAKGQLDEAIAEYCEAIGSMHGLPQAYLAHCGLGGALRDKGRLDEAVAEYREAIRLKKDYPEAHNNLGLALQDKGRLEEAIAEYREAIRIKKDFPLAHSNLGNALSEKGRLDEAIAEYGEALRLKKDYPEAHYGLGNALRDKGRLDEAVAAYGHALRLNKDFPEAHTNLGDALRHKGRLDEAIAEFRQALASKQPFPYAYMAHCKLGLSLDGKGRRDEAMTEYREALRLKKDYPDAHYNLGCAHRDGGQLTEAAAEFRETVRLKKDYAEAHCNLADVLLRQGQFRRAVEEYRLGHEFGSRRPDWPYPSAQWVQNAERLAGLETRLPRLLEGTEQPADPAECLAVAQLCQEYKHLDAGAARWYGEAFALQPALAEDLSTGHRYNAACAAAVAGCGQSQDAGRLSDKERAGLRKQARDWLSVDLRAWRGLLEKEPAKAGSTVAPQLAHWLEDTDFAGVRGEQALAKLPAAERADWQKLWQEVEALRQQTARPPDKAAAPRP